MNDRAKFVLTPFGFMRPEILELADSIDTAMKEELYNAYQLERDGGKSNDAIFAEGTYGDLIDQFDVRYHLELKKLREERQDYLDDLYGHKTWEDVYR